MCGRFFIEDEHENEQLARMIDEAARRQRAITGESDVAMGEVVPASTVAAIAMGKSGKVGVFPMKWGFHLQSGKLIINTRSETALEKPMFKQSMLERRCVIPCSWYFEWETRNDQQSLLDGIPSFQIGSEGIPIKGKTAGQTKLKYAIRPKRAGIIYLAGIYRYEPDQQLPVLSILTREPAPEISFIHNRMPVIFSEETQAAWLDRGADPKEALKLCENEMAYRSAEITE